MVVAARADPDTSRIWWTRHQAVRIEKARAGDRDGDISVDTARSRQVYQEWLTRTRRPYWMLRPLKPSRDAYKLGTRTRTRTEK